eukprot:scaffold626_cov60-Phaeocystis_antarctica.AAC.10
MRRLETCIVTTLVTPLLWQRSTARVEVASRGILRCCCPGLVPLPPPLSCESRGGGGGQSKVLMRMVVSSDAETRPRRLSSYASDETQSECSASVVSRAGSVKAGEIALRSRPPEAKIALACSGSSGRTSAMRRLAS